MPRVVSKDYCCNINVIIGLHSLKEQYPEKKFQIKCGVVLLVKPQKNKKRMNVKPVFGVRYAKSIRDVANGSQNFPYSVCAHFWLKDSDGKIYDFVSEAIREESYGNNFFYAFPKDMDGEIIGNDINGWQKKGMRYDEYPKHIQQALIRLFVVKHFAFAKRVFLETKQNTMSSQCTLF